MVKDSTAMNARSHINISNPINAFSDTLEASEFWGIVWSRFILNGLAPVSALERAKEPVC